MNKFNKYSSILLLSGLLLALSACSDFLDKQPKDQFTDEDYWSSESNLRTFAWKFYTDFIGYGSGVGTSGEFYYQSSPATDCISISDDINSGIFLQYETNANTTNKLWKDNYITIRRANLMLTRLPLVPNMNEEATKHWEGVARFFRAYSHFKLVQRFGDIPYSETYASSNDYANIYLPRTNRNEVIDKVKADLDIAIANLRASDGDNRINKYVALALQARICLYEGTYRKYHNMGEGQDYLLEAKNAANQIMSLGEYSLGSDFKAVYNSIELKGNKEILLYVDYQPNVYMHSVQNFTNSTSTLNGMNKFAIDSYACTDGLPITQSPLYKGDEGLVNVIQDRDPRLKAAIRNDGLGYSGNNPNGVFSSTGYIIAIFNNPTQSGPEITTGGRNHVDAPIFGLAEVLLNYAEACAELGTITQADLDISINPLRTRAGISPLTYISEDHVQAKGIKIEDPKRISALEQISGAVSSITWEIRRDRRAELMTWTYIRYADLMRWKKGDYLDFTKNKDVTLGAKVGKANAGLTTVNEDGYIISYPNFTRTFDPQKHYLSSIPINDITNYANEGIELKQNPGW